jgi:hypothetical protein
MKLLSRIKIENFKNIYSSFDINTETETPKTNHNVDLPINTTSQCENICGPKSQCSVTREQCTSDIDCFGCQPPERKFNYPETIDIPGDNDAGKYTFSQTPQYSTLTTDIGTEASIYNKNAKVPKPYLGIDKWHKSAADGMQYYYKSYNYEYLTEPYKFKQLPEYKIHETATGLFEDYGPLPANASI